MVVGELGIVTPSTGGGSRCRLGLTGRLEEERGLAEEYNTISISKERSTDRGKGGHFAYIGGKELDLRQLARTGGALT